MLEGKFRYNGMTVGDVDEYGNGRGKIITTRNDVYEGNFDNGHLNGVGKVTLHCGQIIEGHFCRGYLDVLG